MMSSNNERKKNFLELGRGAMLERFDYELNSVVDNILDPNTAATKPRKITVTVTLKPDADRQHITHEVTVKSSLQPTNPIVGSTALVQNGSDAALVEMVPQIPGQMDIDGGEQRMPDIIPLRIAAN